MAIKNLKPNLRISVVNYFIAEHLNRKSSLMATYSVYLKGHQYQQWKKNTLSRLKTIATLYYKGKILLTDTK